MKARSCQIELGIQQYGTRSDFKYNFKMSFYTMKKESHP